VNNVARVRRLREGGHTQRAHSIPHHGSYDVAAHSWHLVTLLYVLHPRPSFQLLYAAQFHDVAERWCGDIPAIAKWSSPVLKSESDRLENHVLNELGVLTILQGEDEMWLRACDLLELHLWCLDQINTGNRCVTITLENIHYWFDANKAKVPKPVMDFFLSYSWERSSDRTLLGAPE